MTFVQDQLAAKRTSTRLYVVMLLLVFALSATLYFVLLAGWILIVGDSAKGSLTTTELTLWHPEIYLTISGLTLITVVFASMKKMHQLAAGGEAIAFELGCKRIYPSTEDKRERLLVAVVEEMSIASGMPAPRLYVMPEEGGINAFAAGLNIHDAVVGVTEGTLMYLTRDELQGVIAHEFSHILHGDMKLNIQLTGMLHGISWIYLLGQRITGISNEPIRLERRVRRSSKFFLGGLLLLAFGWLGIVLARLVKSAISRQREYLADATAVQYTRNPEGLAGALKKIGGLQNGSMLHSSASEEFSHFFFSNIYRTQLLDHFATHPPLINRIKNLMPAFDGTYPVVKKLSEYDPFHYERNTSNTLLFTDRQEKFSFNPVELADRIGNPNLMTLTLAQEIIRTAPEILLNAAKEPYGARALTYAFLLDPDDEVRSDQVRTLLDWADPLVRKRIRTLFSFIQKLNPAYYLPLIDIAVPALRELSPHEFLRFHQTVDGLTKHKLNPTCFDYAVGAVVMRNVEQILNRDDRKVQGISLQEAILLGEQLLYSLAYLGHDDIAEADQAFRAGRQKLGIPQSNRKLIASAALFHEALVALIGAPIKLKQRLLIAASICIAYDQLITTEEAQLLRTIAEVLDLPVPPLCIPSHIKGAV